jgi:N-acetylmuramoyl-L-alanine amidase
MLSRIHARFTATSTLTAASSSATISSFSSVHRVNVQKSSGDFTSPRRFAPNLTTGGDVKSPLQKNLHKGFARLSPVFTLVLATFFLAAGNAGANVRLAPAATRASSASGSNGDADTSGSSKGAARHEAATAQFARAEELRANLNAKAPEKRTLAEYKSVVASYRRVYLITPKAGEVQDALVTVGELYTEMGDRFGRSYYQSAVDSYQFLLREYPTSKYREDVTLRVGKLEREQLGDAAGAQKTYEEFLKKFPRSAHKREAQEALAEIALLQHGEEAAANTNDTSSAKDGNASSRRNAEDRSTGTATNESAANIRGNNRSAIIASTGNTAKTNGAARERSNPEASGGENSSAAPAVSGARTEATAATSESTDVVPGPVAGGIEAARNAGQGAPRIRRISTSVNADATRINIDLEDTVAYTSARIKNPDRIFFDLHSARLTPEVARGNIEVSGDLLTAVRVAQNQAGVVRVVLNVNGVKDYAASLLSNPTQLVIFLYGDTRHGGATLRASNASKAKNGKAGTSDGTANETAAMASDAGDVKTVAAKGPVDSSLAPAPGLAGGPSPSSGDLVAKSSRNKKLTANGGSAKPDLIRPSSMAQPTRDGQSTLTRALGLKIGRIVIDPGHGGHDTGTIGPTGLMEKDLCLDVALRLGKIIEQRLPGADILYTRSDDTFIPLEERTNIANQAKADLFVSIHANSSPDHNARGVETYYLNLKGSPEAMEVAARENASSDQGVHDLQDLVTKIARSEKIDESKEFAEDMQDSLAKRMQKSSKTVKDRGVKKAPFVVLIGADMPSILSEISFLSNPADEKLLKQPEYRQRVAEGLYQGIASYLQSLNSMTLNQDSTSPTRKAPAPGTAVASVEQSRNQR